MIIKLKKHCNVKQSPYCGEIREILSSAQYSPDIALAINIKPTTAHFHLGFDEIYFVLDGFITLKLYNSETKEIMEQPLESNELCVITKGIHHRIVKASPENRLCLITVPGFDPTDEHLSDII